MHYAVILFSALWCLLDASYVKLSLPDYVGSVPVDAYSGYVTVDTVAGRALHYVLVKSENSPSTDPLLVWYQGGPGCSGLIGLFLENGPFVIQGTQVGYSDLTWTKFANVLWVEQPAFVGFSYSNSTADRNTGDVKAASDNYMFLQLFVTQEWPEYNGRDLYFTGESYGGVYVPTLTKLVLSDPSGVLYSQFKGFAIGNPVFSCQGSFIGQAGPYQVEIFNILYWHGFVSYSNYQNWTSYGCNDPKNANGNNCQYILNLATNQVGQIVQQKRDVSQADTWPSLDPDDIFQNFCTGNGSLEFSNYPDPNAQTCGSAGQLLATYLNRKDVQMALGVPPTSWTQCSNSINYDVVGNSMVPLYEFFFTAKPGVKIMVYSGDLDILTVPFVFTQPCIAQLSGKITAPWQPWFVNGATAGYIETYDKYIYATLKGAGHEAPEYQPLNAWELISRFVSKGNLDDPNAGKYKFAYKNRLTQGNMLRLRGLSPRI